MELLRQYLKALGEQLDTAAAWIDISPVLVLNTFADNADYIAAVEPLEVGIRLLTEAVARNIRPE